MTQFSDTFLRAGPLGPNYLVDPSNQLIFTAQGLQQTTPGVGPGWYVLFAQPLPQQYQAVSVTITTFDTGHSNFSVGIFAKLQGPVTLPTTYYVLGLSASVPQLFIQKVVNGVGTVLASQATIAIPDNSVLLLNVSGSQITGSLNGAIVLSATDDSPLSSGTTAFITTGPPIKAFSTFGEESPATKSIFGTYPFGPYTEPLDEWFHAVENLSIIGDANSINIPWLLGLSTSVGNATTEAIAKNCVVFCEPEWGLDITGAGQGSLFGNGGVGAGEGGLYVSW